MVGIGASFSQIMEVMKSLKYNKKNADLADSVKNLPKDMKNVPVYLNILATTDNPIIRDEIAYLLCQLCPENIELKKILVSLINSPKTENYKGSLFYALSFLDYSDEECIKMFCDQIHRGNFECMYKAYDMLNNLISQNSIAEKEKLKETLEMIGDNTGRRLDLIEELYNKLQ